jgi:hypothetical protein
LVYPDNYQTTDSGLPLLEPFPADTAEVQENTKTANIEIMIFFMMTSRPREPDRYGQTHDFQLHKSIEAIVSILSIGNETYD